MKRLFKPDWPEANEPHVSSAEQAHEACFGAGVIAEKNRNHQAAMGLYKRAYLWALQADAGRRDKNTRNKGQTQTAKKREHFLTLVAYSAEVTNAKLIAEIAIGDAFVGQARELWPDLSDGEIQDKIINLARRMTAKKLRKS